MRLTFQYNLGYVINEAIFGSPFSGFENIFFRQLFCSIGCVILSCEKIIKTSLSLFLKGKILKRLQNVVPLSGEATLFKTHRGKYTPPPFLRLTREIRSITVYKEAFCC